MNARFLSTEVSFEFGTTISYGQKLKATQSPITGFSNTTVSASVTGLTPSTVYHYRISAVNESGVTNGNDISFITPDLPIVKTSGCSPFTFSSALGSGSVVNDGDRNN